MIIVMRAEKGDAEIRTVLDRLSSVGSEAHGSKGQGNRQIIMGELGIRTLDTTARNTLDISAVALLKGLSHLSVMVDPPHAGGRRELVGPLALAAVAAGADGFMIDVHPEPDTALVDGAQALEGSDFASLMESVVAVANAVDRNV